MRPVTLITGASAGIGAELARVFARHGHELVLVARREEKLAILAAEITAAGGPRPTALSMDLGHRDAVSALAAELNARGLEPKIVVNNAGFGLVGRAARLSRDEQLAMIDLNVRALTELSLAFVESLARHRGGILNVASVAAFMPGPGMAVYYASKAYVLSFSEALHQEFGRRGIRVTALCPGRSRPSSKVAPGYATSGRRASSCRCRPNAWRGSAMTASCAASAWSSPGSATGSRFSYRESYQTRCCCRFCMWAHAGRSGPHSGPASSRLEFAGERDTKCCGRPRFSSVMRQPILIILHQEHSTPGRVGHALQQLGFGLDVRRPRFGEPLPATLSEHTGAIIFGGPMSANDQDDFIRREIDWIGVPFKEEKPFLGICLGAQLCARALGGRVFLHPHGHAEIGYYPIRPTPAGLAVVDPWPEQVYQWHREGFDLPGGAELLAAGDMFEVQAFRYRRSYALQFHPDVTHLTMHKWTTRGHVRLEMPGAKPRDAHFADRAVYDYSARAWLNGFLARWIGD